MPEKNSYSERHWMRNLSVFLLLLTTSLHAQVNQKLADGKLAYYGSDFYSSSKITKETLYKILNEKHSVTKGKPDAIATACSTSDCYAHNSVGYDSARKIMFGELDIEKDGKGKYVVDVYCGQKFYFQSVDQASNMHTEINIEHTWPQSKFSGNFDKNMQKSDMHHLYLTDSMANNRRGNNPFGDIGDNHDELNVEDCDISHLYHAKGGMKFTPPTNHRGNVARSLFYFATRYKMQIDPAQEMILRIWHKNDPVDADELERHEGIAKYQKVRNPFVDFPNLVDTISDF